jgi:hypothetical protein
MEADRRKLYPNQFVSKGGLLAELLNTQGSSKQPECRTRRGRNEVALGIETPVEVIEKRVARPASSIGKPRLGIEIRKSAFGRAEVTLAGIHRLIGIVGNRENTGGMGKMVTAPETGCLWRIRRRLGPREDFLHHLATEPLSRMRHLHGLKDIRVIG